MTSKGLLERGKNPLQDGEVANVKGFLQGVKKYFYL